MRGSGGILVDAEGRRFANELTTRSVLTEAIFKAGAPIKGGKKVEETEGIAPTVAYLLLDQEAADAFGPGVLGFYMSKCSVGGEGRGGDMFVFEWVNGWVNKWKFGSICISCAAKMCTNLNRSTRNVWIKY